MRILELKGVNKSFGGLKAVEDFNLSIEEGGILGLIGPNGAGKSTIFNCIALPPQERYILRGKTSPIKGLGTFAGKGWPAPSKS
jgi:ABC-type branched-subunit amino acid transport system ATPase component